MLNIGPPEKSEKRPPCFPHKLQHSNEQKNWLTEYKTFKISQGACSKLQHSNEQKTWLTEKKTFKISHFTCSKLQHSNEQKTWLTEKKTFKISQGACSVMTTDISCNEIRQLTYTSCELWVQTRITVLSRPFSSVPQRHQIENL